MPEQRKKRKIPPQETKKLVPFMRDFNVLATEFLKLLNKKVEAKEKRIHVLVTGVSVPMRPTYNMITVRTIDIHHTEYKKKGELTQKQAMDWEKSFRQNRGVLI